MLTRLFVVVVTMILFPAVALSNDGPLSPARAGKIWCGYPSENKTCMTMYSYKWNPDGTIDSLGESAIAINPQIIMRSKSRITIEGEHFCEEVDTSSIESLEFLLNHKPMPPEGTKDFRNTLFSNLSEIMGKKLCFLTTPRVAVPGEFVVHVTLDGTRRPDKTYWMKWIGEGDGYTLEHANFDH